MPLHSSLGDKVRLYLKIIIIIISLHKIFSSESNGYVVLFVFRKKITASLMILGDVDIAMVWRCRVSYFLWNFIILL